MLEIVSIKEDTSFKDQEWSLNVKEAMTTFLKHFNVIKSQPYEDVEYAHAGLHLVQHVHLAIHQSVGQMHGQNVRVKGEILLLFMMKTQMNF